MQMTAAISQRFAAYLADVSAGLPQSSTLRAIREGLLWLVPGLLVSAFILVLAAVFAHLPGLEKSAEDLLVIRAGINDLIPHMAAASIAYMLALKHRMAGPPVAFVSLIYIAIVDLLIRHLAPGAIPMLLFIAISMPMITVPLLAWFSEKTWSRLMRGELAGSNVRMTMNLIVPACLVGTGLVAVLMILSHTLDLGALAEYDWLTPEAIATAPYESGILYAAMNSLLWFFGIHGAHALLPASQAMEAAVQLNRSAIEAGLSPSHVMNASLLSIWVFVGGSGGTFSLILAILLLCRNQTLRLMALASLPIALFNVNEILLFGLPLIFNPRLFLPFVLVPVVNVVIAVTASQAGWVATPSTLVSFVSPVGLNAYLATGGDWTALALQAGVVLVGLLIYAPFILHIDRMTRTNREVYLKSLDTMYTQLHEDATLYSYDPIGTAREIRERQARLRDTLEKYSNAEFILEFQPQVHGKTGEFLGCEALLRVREADGKTRFPAQFVDALREAGLMTGLDLWVARAAVKQDSMWQNQGLAVHTSINVTAETLIDKHALSVLLETLEEAEGRLAVEITEQALASNPTAIGAAIQALHGIGVKVYIDDFGTGYSSLGYLHQFDFDVLKIDRSFVLALDQPRGENLMSGVLDLANRMGLRCVVEGVETETQRARVIAEHPVAIQGWLYSRSLPGDLIPAFAAAHATQ